MVQPTWLHHPVYVDTYGPQVCDVAAAAGFAPYPEQELLIDLLFAVGPDGRSVSFETDWIAPRQVMKTGGIIIAEIGWLFVTKQKLIVHSAHELSTTEEAFNDLAAAIERTPSLSKRLKPTRGERPGVFEGNGRWSIHTRDGQRVKYKARLKSGGRGLTGWKVVLDEGFALEPKQIGSLLPTLTSVPDPQVLIASSAGMEDSKVLRDARDRGRAKSDPTQTYAEWGDKDAWSGCADRECTHAKNATGCAADDEERWHRIIPGLGERIQVSTIRSFRRSMPPEEFLREFMVWWDEPPPRDTPEIYGEGRWDACAFEGEDESELSDLFEKLAAPPAIGVAVSLDREWASIAAAASVEVLEDPGDPEAEPVDRSFVAPVDRRPGVDWLVAEVKRIQDRTDCAVILDKGGPAKDLIKDFEDGDVAVDAVSLDEYAEGSSRFYDKVRSRRLLHPGATELNDAVDAAVWRTVNDRRVPGRKQSAEDISMLEAAILADLGAEKSSAFNVY